MDMPRFLRTQDVQRQFEHGDLVKHWAPEKQALARQWLIEKRLTFLREKMPSDAFEGLAESVYLLLEPWELMAKR